MAINSVEWTPEADEYLCRFGPTAPLAVMLRHLGVTEQQLKQRAKLLGVELGSKAALAQRFELPPTFENFPATPADALPREWHGGILICLDKPPIPGIVRIVVNRQRGHAETQSEHFTRQLLGGEDTEQDLEDAKLELRRSRQREASQRMRERKKQREAQRLRP